MRRPVTLFLFLCLPFLSRAQRTAPQRNWAIGFTPAIIPMPGEGHFGVQPGIAYRFHSHLSLLAEVALFAGKKDEVDSSFTDKKYFRIKPELRYFFHDTSVEVNGYVGLQFTYARRTFGSRFGYYYDHLPGDSVVYYDRARVNSPVITTSIQLGAIIPVGKSLQMDWFIGLGLRFINTDYGEIVNAHASEKFESTGGLRISLPPPSYESPGNLVRFHLSLGIRLLYNLPIS